MAAGLALASSLSAAALIDQRASQPSKKRFALSSVPTPQMRTGDFSQLLSLDTPIVINDPLTGQPFPGNIIPPDRLSSVAQKAQDRFFPVPNRDRLVNNLAWVHPYPSDQFHADVYSVRVDHRFSGS